MGLDNADYLATVTGLDGKGSTTRTLVAIDGQPQGIFRLAAAKPLAAADLAPIPRDATLAAAGRLDANAALELLLAQLKKVDPSAHANVAEAIDQIGKEVGIDLQDDLLKPLGDVWCVYNSPSEGGLLVTGLTGVVQVKDHDHLEATLNKLIALFQGHMESIDAKLDHMGQDSVQMNRFRMPRIVKTRFAGQDVYYFDNPIAGIYLAPAWCLTKPDGHEGPSSGSQLIVSTFPQNIKAYLARGKSFESLAAVPEVSEALQGGAVALSYCDTRKLAEFTYPLLCMGGKLISSELNREGIPLDASALPSAAAIFPHLQASVSVVRRGAAGIEVESRGSLAGIGAGPLFPTAAFWLFAFRTSSMTFRRNGPRPSRCHAHEQSQADRPGHAQLRKYLWFFAASLYRRQGDRQAALELARGHFAFPRATRSLRSVPSRRALGQPAQQAAHRRHADHIRQPGLRQRGGQDPFSHAAAQGQRVSRQGQDPARGHYPRTIEHDPSRRGR